MRYLYLDNVRGFSDCTIPLSDVTFFVGDNSTGKSTILALTHFLINIRPFETHDFDSANYQLGGFQDLISRDSTDKDRFTLGFGELAKLDLPDQKINNRKRIFFISYESDEGLPSPTRYSFIYNNYFTTIRKTKNALYLRRLNLAEHEAFGRTISENENKINSEEVATLANLHNSKGNRGFKIIREVSSVIDVGGVMAYALFSAPNEESERTNYAPYHLYFSPPVTSSWIAPIRAKPRRTYDSSRVKYSPEGNHTPYVIRKRLHKGTSESRFKELIIAYGKDGHLFDDVYASTYGKDEYGPFELKVQLDNSELSIANVGYGVSQVLPVVIEGLQQHDGSLLFIQQPEVHLHPRAQAAFGTLLSKLAIEDKKLFCIETHSDYLIDRFRLELSKSKKDVNAAILFFKRTKNGNTAHPVEIQHDGKYSENQPRAFREFFIKESMQLLEV